MPSEWKVTSDAVDGAAMYAAYRVIDEDAGDHSGNREYALGWAQRRDIAQGWADNLNAKGRAAARKGD